MKIEGGKKNFLAGSINVYFFESRHSRIMWTQFKDIFLVFPKFIEFINQKSYQYLCQTTLFLQNNKKVLFKIVWFGNFSLSHVRASVPSQVQLRLFIYKKSSFSKRFLFFAHRAMSNEMELYLPDFLELTLIFFPLGPSDKLPGESGARPGWGLFKYYVSMFLAFFDPLPPRV